MYTKSIDHLINFQHPLHTNRKSTTTLNTLQHTHSALDLRSRSPPMHPVKNNLIELLSILGLSPLLACRLLYMLCLSINVLCLASCYACSIAPGHYHPEQCKLDSSPAYSFGLKTLPMPPIPGRCSYLYFT